MTPAAFVWQPWAVVGAFLAAAASGAVWFVAQGGDTAVLWRGLHGIAARSFAVLMLLHVVAVSLHLLDLVRD